MYVRNVHQRTLPKPLPEVAALLDTLASSHDRLWPHEQWPAMHFPGGVGIGARGGHGPIRYSVVAVRPGESVAFQFSAPAGFDGGHSFDLTPTGNDRTIIQHTLEMHTSGSAIFSWPLIFRPLHDALIEDAFDKAEKNLGLATKGTAWTPQVKLLRRLLRAIQTRRR